MTGRSKPNWLEVPEWSAHVVQQLTNQLSQAGRDALAGSATRREDPRRRIMNGRGRIDRGWKVRSLNLRIMGKPFGRGE
jgi:hypothetical protein